MSFNNPGRKKHFSYLWRDRDRCMSKFRFEPGLPIPVNPFSEFLETPPSFVSPQER